MIHKSVKNHGHFIWKYSPQQPEYGSLSPAHVINGYFLLPPLGSDYYNTVHFKTQDFSSLILSTLILLVFHTIVAGIIRTCDFSTQKPIFRQVELSFSSFFAQDLEYLINF